MDPRIRNVADTILHHSLDVKAGEKLLISVLDDGAELVNALVEQAYACGAVPFVSLERADIRRALLEGASQAQLELMARKETSLMSKMDCYVLVESFRNSSELSQLPQDKQALYAIHYESPISAAMQRLRWVTLTYPSLGMAQNAGMSQESFIDYYFKVMTMDYKKLGKASQAMARRMHDADQVRIVAPGTDLTVSLKGFTALVAAGTHNLPDGEIASTPVRDSANGTIAFNIPSLYNGFLFRDVKLTFEHGKLVDASANDTDRFWREISVDEGCRYIGEFSMGTNPLVDRSVKDITFDEKMFGSMHLALGASYGFPGRDNGNRSAIHWDLIQCHRKEYGGGEVWLDGELVRKDGVYLPDDLKALDPDVYLADGHL